ncbi:hypothetical protein BABINDRAFT_40370 [Babjeviella inositovora NRRL Y-12698]|uniref:C2H2-type domain-containing protein n=1 Tax=Babjeviella inositovora NRRL Y-12698 TaxID=984486 RepID=A0A1E3QJZ9_9ASCO|nr:uncharacterized protein BABINDRAFT_40370 [Babjeviella inositovora NRRL Y-12698]ODQ77938.1 hypothetical protein BABINDRAFT_40370 [Babjeviella inositovora NRRL Y-12698]
MQYTCNSCGLAFASPDDQRIHMKSDWHRYNLKRRVADLPAISEENFKTKVAVRGRKGGKLEADVQKTVTKKEQRQREKEALMEKKRQLLEAARASMIAAGTNTQAQFDQITSELELIKIQEPVTTPEPAEATEEAQPELSQEEQLMQAKLKNQVEIPANCCLFCPNKSFPNAAVAEDHMFRKHGLYIPERDYLVDKAGLMQYLSEKIGLGNVCIVCNFQARTLEAVRAHMLAKFHCRIPYESESEKLEISDFYDFSSTYGDAAAPEGDATTPEGEWEDVEEGEDDSDEEAPLPTEVAINNGHELLLPSGVVVGHRSLSRYYKQSLRPEQVLSEGQGTVIAAESRHMLSVMDKKEYAEKKREWGWEKHTADQFDRKAKKFINNQPHYFDQLLQ